VNIQKILVPVDFSHCGDAALKMAAALAREWDAKLLIVHVEEPALAYGGGEMYYGVPEPRTADLARMLAEIRPADPAVSFEHRLITGEPAEAIVRLAEGEGVGLIVMGTHGRTGFSRLLMGSVAEAVVREAKCAVLTLKQPVAALAAG
jgi:nucleotide-binding universal stress UspA family protein